MSLISTAPVGLVAAIHSYILVLECFLWTTPRGRKTFRLTPEFAQQTRTLAANQGLYNGFLAAGLIWGVLHPDAGVGRQIKLFFLGCVATAGVVGAVTAKRAILYVQTVPALVAGLGVWFGQ